MVDVPVNENIDEYKVTVFAGLTAVQVISAILSVFAGGIEFLIFNLALGVDMTICAFVILPTVGILVYGINFNKDGLNIIEFIKQGRWQKRKMFLGYHSTENMQNYSANIETANQTFEEAEQQKEEEFKTLVKKFIAVGILFVFLFLGGLISIIVLIL